MDWTWSWVPYGTGAHFGDNPFFDWVRVACLVIGIMLLCGIGRVLKEGRRREELMPLTQEARFFALALAVVYICFTEFAVFGTPATPRLPVGLLTLTVGTYGVWGIRRKQRTVPPIV